MDANNVLSSTDLTIGYAHGHHATVVQQHLQFKLHAGELTCLIGANGSGKSTLLRTLAGLQPALHGQVTLWGKPFNSYSLRERSQLIGLVLTDRIQAGGLTVSELVSLGRQPYTNFLGTLHQSDHLLVEQALRDVGLDGKSLIHIAQLSDGEKQKAMIAKALVQQSRVIILDEPTAFLDVVSRIEIMQLLHELAVKQQCAILLSTHDVEQAIMQADALWMMHKDKGLVCGKTHDLIEAHAMDSLFDHTTLHFDYEHLRFAPSGC